MNVLVKFMLASEGGFVLHVPRSILAIGLFASSLCASAAVARADAPPSPTTLPPPSVVTTSDQTVAQAIPVPQPSASAVPKAVQARQTPSPLGPFTYSGNLRAFYFVRQNASQNGGNPNRTAFLPGGTLQLGYTIGKTPFSIGTAYTGAYAGDINGPNPQFNTKVDNTVPAFPLSTFDEAYVQYKNAGVTADVGDFFWNFAWMPASDTRIKPSAYQGGDISFKVIKPVTIGVSRITRFESRTSSNFQPDTLLTAPIPGQPAPIVNRRTAGALHTYLLATTKRFTARAENYQFYDLANLYYVDGKYSLAPKSTLNPFIAFQYVNDQNAGRSLLGLVNNNTLGFQLGVSASKQLAFTFGYDEAPTHYQFGTTAALAQRGAFLPAGGTATTALIAPGRYRTAFGGIASPYSDAFATDPLFTTSISQGMVDRRSAGQAFKVAAVFISPNKRFKGIASEAYYQYDNLNGQNRTFEDNVDLQYFFNNVGAGLYKGLSIRQRYANRDQPTLPYNFKYVRTQLEYDF